MESLLDGIAQHGYSILFALVFLQAIGLPVPVALALLIAGAASTQASLYAPFVVAGSVAAMIAGDALMFLLGRYTGWWLLGLLCRVSLNPETCILSSADSFYKRGRTLLVIAKFIPGINTMAPPLAGTMGMRFFSFLRLDAAGALLYIGSYFAVGFMFSDALKVVTRGYRTFGRAVSTAIIALLAGYIAYQCWQWIRERMRQAVSFALPREVAEHLPSGASIYDVRSHGYLDAKAYRIKGSQRLDPNALNRTPTDFPQERAIYVYCTCVREATSARVARELANKGVHVTVIRGGLRAWKKAGLPVEAVPPEELAVLPAFV